MAKRFSGFTPEQLGKIDPSLAGKQSDEQSAMISANPALAARVGKMAMAAQKRLDNPTKGFAEGGTTGQSALDSAQQAFADAQTRLQEAMAASQAKPEDQGLADAVGKAQAAVNAAQAKMQSAQSSMRATDLPTGAEATKAAMTGDMTTTTDVAKTTATQKEEGEIAEGVGQVGEVADVAPTVAATAPDVSVPVQKEAVTYEALPASASTEEIMKRLEAATGRPSADAIADAATMDPQELAQLGLSAAQISAAQRVEEVPDRKLEEGEMIEGATVDMERVKAETNFQAATGSPSSDATVQGQLTGLMEDFEGKEPPAWAAGAMRAASAQMAARGLSASSMAGQALVQAAMESALPIAQADATAFQRFEMQNLSNKQQSAMFAAEQRAKFLNLEFNQEFQARVTNAAKISDIANMNFTADQQVALENARMAQSVDLANLNAQNAKVLADSAAMSQLDMANLNNRQQAQVQNAKAFLQMDMQNLSNEQQTATFKTQQLANALLSDTAAENASRQFNASSENQTNQFFSNLTAQISQFNTEQSNAMNRFNAGEENAIAQFNATRKDVREQFNSTNSLVIAQANAQWAQAITTADNAAQNQANRDAAMASNQFTATAYNNILQRERDAISYAFKATEGDLDRENRLAIQSMQLEADMASAQAQIDAGRGRGWGTFFASVAPEIVSWALK